MLSNSGLPLVYHQTKAVVIVCLGPGGERVERKRLRWVGGWGGGAGVERAKAERTGTARAGRVGRDGDGDREVGEKEMGEEGRGGDIGEGKQELQECSKPPVCC